jgi:hypothetical protein
MTAHKVASGGSAADGNLILNTKPLASKASYDCFEILGQVLNAGDSIQALASAGSQVSVVLDVMEIV